MLVSIQRAGRLIYYAAFLLVLFAAMTSISTAKVACIRLTSEHTADTTDCEEGEGSSGCGCHAGPYPFENSAGGANWAWAIILMTILIRKSGRSRNNDC